MTYPSQNKQFPFYSYQQNGYPMPPEGQDMANVPVYAGYLNPPNFFRANPSQLSHPSAQMILTNIPFPGKHNKRMPNAPPIFQGVPIMPMTIRDPINDNNIRSHVVYTAVNKLAIAELKQFMNLFGIPESVPSVRVSEYFMKHIFPNLISNLDAPTKAIAQLIGFLSDHPSYTPYTIPFLLKETYFAPQITTLTISPKRFIYEIPVTARKERFMVLFSIITMSSTCKTILIINNRVVPKLYFGEEKPYYIGYRAGIDPYTENLVISVESSEPRTLYWLVVHIVEPRDELSCLRLITNKTSAVISSQEMKEKRVTCITSTCTNRCRFNAFTLLKETHRTGNCICPCCGVKVKFEHIFVYKSPDLYENGNVQNGNEIS